MLKQLHNLAESIQARLGRAPSCAWVEERLIAYCDWDLPEHEFRASERHLARCPACAKAYAGVELLVNGMQEQMLSAQFGAPSPADCAAAVMARIDAYERVQPPSRVWREPVWTQRRLVRLAAGRAPCCARSWRRYSCWSVRPPTRGLPVLQWWQRPGTAGVGPNADDTYKDKGRFRAGLPFPRTVAFQGAGQTGKDTNMANGVSTKRAIVSIGLMAAGLLVLASGVGDWGRATSPVVPADLSGVRVGQCAHACKDYLICTDMDDCGPHNPCEGTTVRVGSGKVSKWCSDPREVNTCTTSQGTDWCWSFHECFYDAGCKRLGTELYTTKVLNCTET